MFYRTWLDTDVTKLLQRTVDGLTLLEFHDVSSCNFPSTGDTSCRRGNSKQERITNQFGTATKVHPVLKPRCSWQLPRWTGTNLMQDLPCRHHNASLGREIRLAWVAYFNQVCESRHQSIHHVNSWYQELIAGAEVELSMWNPTLSCCKGRKGSHPLKHCKCGACKNRTSKVLTWAVSKVLAAYGIVSPRTLLRQPFASHALMGFNVRSCQPWTFYIQGPVL